MLCSDCLQISAYTLIKENPKSYNLLKETALDQEAYGILNIIEHKREKLDDENFIFKCGERSVVIGKKERYTHKQCCDICDLAGVDKKKIEEFKNVKPA